MARDLETTHENIDGDDHGYHSVLMTTLLEDYSKCDSVSIARELFDKMPQKNLFYWNIIINGHVHNSNYKDAVRDSTSVKEGNETFFIKV